MARIVAAASLLALASCSSSPVVDGPATGRFKPSSKATTAQKARSTPAPGVRLPDALPPASMFVGGGSSRTQPVRYCLRASADASALPDCATLSPARPAPLAGPSGVPVMFSLSAAPAAARLELPAAAAASQQVPLTPGTAMIWQASLPPGTYPLMLVATYPQSEVTWQFTLRVEPEK